MSEMFPYVTELGWEVDKIQIFLIAMMAFWFIACNAVMFYFVLKYKRKGPNDKVSTVAGNHTLEIVWTVVPTIIVLIIFFAGINVWTDMRTMPTEDYLDIGVQGQKWSWNFTYNDPKGDYVFEGEEGEEIKLDGKVTPKELYVPVGRNVVFTMKSVDVIHSMYIPEFRVKEDVVPSIYTKLWFRAEKPGTYNIFCTEYCGDEHSGMLGKVHVLEEEGWERFVRDLPIDPRDKKRKGVELGEYLYVQNNCVGCHSIDGSKNIGPSFLGLLNTERVVNTANGQQTVVADENYIVESIKYPKAKLVVDYPENQMPAFDGVINEEGIEAIILYMKSLGN